jgi:hypothetical protein
MDSMWNSSAISLSQAFSCTQTTNHENEVPNDEKQQESILEMQVPNVDNPEEFDEE